MDSINIILEDKEQLERISKFVSLIASVYKHSSINTIDALADKLADMCAAEKDTPVSKPVNLVFNKASELYTDQLYCLYSMCEILNNIGVEEVNAGIDVYKVLKKRYTKSDVPRFLAMLKDNHIPAEHCVGLFSSWCSCEGNAVIAEKCMEIQAKYNINMTAVWEWVYSNKCSMHTDWTDEVDRYKEAING